MATHTLLPSRATLHGHWSRDLAPALTIDPGDTVRFATLEAMWCAERRPIKWPWERMGPYRKGLDDGHALTGPVGSQTMQGIFTFDQQFQAYNADNASSNYRMQLSMRYSF